MSVLGLPFWELPKTLWIRGECVSINTDFRAGIRVRQMWWDPYFRERGDLFWRYAGRILCGEEDAFVWDEDAAVTLLWYLLDGRVPCSVIRRRLSQAASDDETEAAVPCGEGLSYVWDMPMIAASFLQVYGISLAREELHLWEFDALLAALPGDCALCRTLRARGVDLSQIADDTLRAAAAAERIRARVPKDSVLYEMCNDSLVCTVGEC